MFKVKSIILKFFLLILKVIFESTLSCIYKNLKFIKIFLKKSFELGLG